MSMVRSVLEYAPVWSPSIKHYISKLEMVQRRAARFVLNDFLDIHQSQECGQCSNNEDYYDV